MSSSSYFDGADLDQMRAHGISAEEAERQLRIFANPRSARGPVRPCRIADGVLRLSRGDFPRLLERWKAAATGGRLTKMVPASGAATRMFRLLRAYLDAGAPSRAELERRAAEADTDAQRLLHFFDSLDQLALRRPLVSRLGEGSLDDPQKVAETLLAADGLGLDSLPKALVPFHDYPEGPRTPLEEHFVEAAGYLAAGRGTAHLHFTVPEASREEFVTVFSSFREPLERRFGLRFVLTTSIQEPGTDTLAVDLDNRPFRTEEGRLLFRPAGHGSLLGNLERLGGDLVLIKNIDNVAPERLQEITVLWKRLLVGLAAELEERLGELAQRFAAGDSPIDEAFEVLRSRLAVLPPPAILEAPADRQRSWLIDRLERPLRVCGVVPSAGEPGGGPFWVPGEDGGLYGQIVEAAQIDREDPEQEAAWASSTHFNPVDLICKVRDASGRPYPLERFVDPHAAIITRKSHGARPLKALERPGLWNGSMAGWNTAFVEVPAETFHPVKTILDLLRPGHRV